MTKTLLAAAVALLALSGGASAAPILTGGSESTQASGSLRGAVSGAETGAAAATSLTSLATACQALDAHLAPMAAIGGGTLKVTNPCAPVEKAANVAK